MRLVATLATAAAAMFVAGCDQVGVPGTGGPKPVPGKNTFVGTVKTEWLNPNKPADYYRDMRLLESFSYVDPDGVVWEVPKGASTDGASIPWGFWNIVGGPFDGPYREAAVVHDYFCDNKTRTWEDTHRMFYNAMLARGISENLSRTMYAGVRYGGPRWDPPAPPAPAEPAKSGLLDWLGVVKAAFAGATPPAPAPAPAVVPAAEAAPVPAAGPQRPLQDPDTPAPPIRSMGRSIGATKELRTFDDIRQWIEKDNPSLEEIDRRVEEMRRLEGKTAEPTP